MKSLNTPTEAFAIAAAQLKQDFQDGYIRAREKLENSVVTPLLMGGTVGSMVGPLALTVSKAATQPELISVGMDGFMKGGVVGLIGGHLLMKFMAYKNEFDKEKSAPQPNELLSWLRPAAITAFGVSVADKFNNSVDGNMPLVGAGIVLALGAAGFSSTIAQMAGMAARGIDAVRKHPVRTFG